MNALREIGRDGDFSRIPGLRQEYKSHRQAEQIRLGLATDKPVRKRQDWGKVGHARLKPSSHA